MDFNEKLKALRVINKVTQLELSEELGVSTVTIQKWESGASSPSSSMLPKICNALDTSADYLVGTTDSNNHSFSAEESLFLSDFRKLDHNGKKIIMALCKMQLEKQEAEKPAPVRRHIPKYLTPAAAGSSFPLGSDDFEMIPGDSGLAAKADFAIKVQGNSMFPYLNDGDTAYVQRTETLDVGDVGVFSVDGSMYCKQYYERDGVPELVSVNPEFRHTNVVFGDCNNSFVKIYGRVLLESSIPLPEYLKSGI